MTWFNVHFNINGNALVQADNLTAARTATNEVLDAMLQDPEVGDHFGEQGVHLKGGIGGSIDYTIQSGAIKIEDQE